MRVAVVGAGPAGASAAIVLARVGTDVSIFEKARWPREKTCGDGLTPDAIALLETLGVTLPQDAPRCLDATVVAPRGARAIGSWNGTATVVPRIDLDAAIVAAAIASGATFQDATTVREVSENGTLVVAGTRERFDAIVLAEGATGGLGASLGFGAFAERQVAIRGYVDTRKALRATYNVVYDRALTPGYGWIFPVCEHRANVGVCVGERTARSARGPRALLDTWLTRDATARALLGENPDIYAVRGGIIPTGRACRRAGRTFAVGDAAGVADPLSAEGISQAIATGIAAAHTILRSDDAFEAALRDYDRNAREARRLRALFAWTLDPMIALAAKRPAHADHLVASGFTLKTDMHWFHGVRGALLRPAGARRTT